MPNHPYHYRGETETLDDAARAALPGQFVAPPDGVVHYELAGPAGGPVVVLVPGISVPYTTWDANVPALANAGLRVLRFDLYGRGYSDRPDVVYDADLFDRQIVNLLAALGLSEPVSLVGLSMGGAVVTHFAAQHPERVRRLVLIDPLSATPAATLPVKLVLVSGLGERLMDWFGNRILVGGQSHDFNRPELVAAFQEKYRSAMKYRGFKNAILSTVRSIPGWRIAEAYERVGQAHYPVLLFWGRQDRTIPFETHRKVQALIPRAEF
ncbi:MAG TPA: alpha/beta hydrolase, partial [Humisphaera sp.]